MILTLVTPISVLRQSKRSLKPHSDQQKRSVKNCDCEKNEIVKHCWEKDQNLN